ncbi:MAG: NAD-dependent epimerase/dehydratase family protein [Albidovulum sp.]
MHAVITGGSGFLLSHVIRSWLIANPSAHVTEISTTPPDADLKDFLSSVLERVTFVTGDVRCPEEWIDQIKPDSVDLIVHGAAVCPINTDAEKTLERASIATTVDINVMGTVAVLEWARRLPNLRRLVYVSSGVYGYGRKVGPNAPHEGPIEESAPLMPQDATYDITKAAGEWLVSRYRDLFAMDCVSVRPSAIYGPMDRDSAGRAAHVAPWHMAKAAVAGKLFKVNDLDARYDWLYGPDAARAFVEIMDAKQLNHDVYNISYGMPVTLRDLAAGVRVEIPDFRIEESTAPEFVQPTNFRGGVWSVRSNQRLMREFGWHPTPAVGAMADYIRWLNTCRDR